jgi:dTDP-4-amino-4,6-dideoxygalactose transaminase
MELIRFSEPYITGQEQETLKEILVSKRHSGNGKFTKKCQTALESKFGYTKVLLTQSCTDALEMTALLADVNEGDEVILPSYTFVSSANAFALRGAKLVFCDSLPDHPNMDVDAVEKKISAKTKAIVCVHYGGVPCDMSRLRQLCDTNNIILIEDAAQAIGVQHENKYLGSFGDLACLSFHETKNISSGEGGALIINNETLQKRAEIIWEKGTNRSAFFRNEVDKYNWVDLGSSYLPSEFTAGLLLCQLNAFDLIQRKRWDIWNFYFDYFSKSELSSSIIIGKDEDHNAHIFALRIASLELRTELIDYLKSKGINAVFHYQCLHDSPFIKQGNDRTSELKNAKSFEEQLLRLPLHSNLDLADAQRVCDEISTFYAQ